MMTPDSIENVALIERLRIVFDGGLTALVASDRPRVQFLNEVAREQ
jgi:hypothetical protein